MKKIIFSLCLLTFNISIFSQVSTYPSINKKQNFKDKVNHVYAPTVGTTGQDTTATRAYARGYGGTGTLMASDTSLMLIPYINRADTAAMMLHYARLLNPVFLGIQKVSTTDTLSTKAYARSVGGGTGKLAISDTSAMLAHYALLTEVGVGGITASDTSGMLSHYVDRTDNLAKLSVSDTATMLAHYALLTEIGGVGVYVDIADSSGNAEGNYITRQDLLVEGGLHVNISDTSTMLSHYIAREDTATMLAAYPRYFYAGNGSLTLNGADPISLSSTASTSLTLPTSGTLATTQNINDSLDAYILGAGTGISIADSSGNAAGNYITRQDLLVEGGLHVNISDTATMLSHYIAREDTSAMLTNYINKADTATMLSHYIAREDTATMLSHYVDRADTATMLGHYIDRADTAAMLSNYPLDTEALLEADVKTFFVFSAGGGNPADTLAMTDSTILGSFYNGGSKSIVVDSLNAIMDHGLGLDTLAFNIVWGKSFQTVSPSGHLSNTQFNCGRTAGTPAQITNLTTGNTFVTFDHTVIPPGCRVWGKFMYVPAASLKRKPKYFEVSLIGHYQ